MKPIQFDGVTSVIGGPSGWDTATHGDIAGLPVKRDKGVIYSRWALAWKERFAILFGKPIELAIVGLQMPPVSLIVLEN